jgi:hypothetical protein
MRVANAATVASFSIAPSGLGPMFRSLYESSNRSASVKVAGMPLRPVRRPSWV